MDVYARHWVVVPLLFVASIGCRGTDPSIELLEHELRWMEDQLYLMDRQLTETCDQLDSCRRNNTALHNEIAKLQRPNANGNAVPATDSPRPRSVMPQINESDLAVPKIDLGTGANGSGIDVEVPDVTIPDVTVPEVPNEPTVDEAPQIESLDGESIEPLLEDDGSQPLDDLIEDHSANRNVTQIKLNPRLTGGYDRDGMPGDEGLIVVVEPLDAIGQYQATSGEVSIVVVDPKRSGSAGRVARWDFDSVEASRFLRQSLLGKGFHLKLPWPNVPPQTDRLRVYARYIGNDGRELKAFHDVRIDVDPSHATQGLASTDLPTISEPPSTATARTTEPTSAAREIEIGIDELLNPPDAPTGPTRLARHETNSQDSAGQTAPPSENTTPAKAPSWSPQR